MSDGSAADSERVELQFTLDERAISFVLDETLYSLDAIYGACYLFIDRCYVFLERPGDKLVRARLRTREAASAEALEALAGEFGNELLNQVLRRRISDSTKTIREYYMARAFFGGSSRATIDALLAELDAEELQQEPLEVSVPWEQKE